MRLLNILRLFLLLSLFVSFEAKAQYESLDQKCGFRDLKFGVPIESVTGLTEVSSSDPLVKVYVRHSDNMKIGAYPVQEIRYVFYKAKLYSIIVDIIGADYVKNGVREVLISEYGMGNGNNESMTWRGKKVHMSYSDKPELANAAFLFITDISLSNQYFSEQTSRTNRVPSGL